MSNLADEVKVHVERNRRERHKTVFHRRRHVLCQQRIITVCPLDQLHHLTHKQLIYNQNIKLELKRFYQTHTTRKLLKVPVTVHSRHPPAAME